MTFKLGDMLVATSALMESNFFRTVILLFQVSDEGAGGVILNRPLNLKMSQVVEATPSASNSEELGVFWGGPVSGPVIALHDRLYYAESMILQGVFMTTRRTHITELVREGAQPCRMFVGYAGWGPGQLENEIAMGSWYVIPTTPEDVFSSPDSLWKLGCDKYGREVLDLGFLSRPGDPHQN